MCGRYARTSSAESIHDEFDVKNRASLDVGPSYNIAPSQRVLIIVNESGEKTLRACRWGFVPSWAKDAVIGQKMINARAETVATKPSFRTAFRKKRCLIIADGFYEWQRTNDSKFPVYIHLNSGRPFGFAGLYNNWTTPEGETVCTCTIITTEANELLAPIHDRMPVILPGDREDLWLDPEAGNEALSALLRPYPSEEMAYHAVSTRVNFPGYNEPDAIMPLTIRRKR